MADDRTGTDLKALEARIAAAKSAHEAPQRRADEHYSAANQAWRMVIELVSGLGIGVGIGMGLDAVFGTQPIMLVLFVLLGFAAGVKVMLRTAQEMSGAPDGQRADQTPARSTPASPEADEKEG